MPEGNDEEGMRFDILKAAGGDGTAARLGRLALPRREAVDTPNFFATTSRGVVPHLTPDTIAKYGSFPGVYMAMEDLVEKSQKNVTNIPAVAKIPAPDGKRLHAFTGLPSSLATILGPRRSPAVKASVGNGDSHVQLFTSNGFQPLTNAAYLAAVRALQPDIAIPLADMHYAAAARTPKSKGLLRMCERTEDWMAELARTLDPAALRASATALFAPTLPAPYSIQWQYLESLCHDDLRARLSGLAVYDVDLVPELVNYPSLLALPRLSLDTPAGPHEILRQISLGVDTFLLPFVNAVSDSGVALTFAFPAPSSSSPPSSSSSPSTTTTGDTNSGGAGLLPLGVDVTAPANAASLAPLVDGCPCYACASHHRAYLHHLLNAREMLAWTLLQLHNHHVASAFFAGVRASLAAGAPRGFEDERRRFHASYEAALPPGTGTRPRARGYHFKSEHGDARRNKVTWQLLQEGQEEKALAIGARTRKGLVETPVVPGRDVDAGELVRGGLGAVDIKDAI